MMERVADYPIYDEHRLIDDVGLCPRCQDVDIFPGQRVCGGCVSEITADDYVPTDIDLWFICEKQGCNNKPFLVWKSDLKDAGGVVRCEYCDEVCKQVTSFGLEEEI